MDKLKAVEVINFSKKFGNKIVHENLSFDVYKGECLGVVGGSGVGKSIILRSLIGLERPDQGQILIFGENIVPLDERNLVSIRKKVAYAFQGGALFDSMTVFENVSYPLIEHTSFTKNKIIEKVTSILKQFGLEEAQDLFPIELSGGMQKRVGIARAIVLEPEIILYDEPTAGLDPFNTKKTQEIILQLKRKGKTSILVTHDIASTFTVCDRVLMLMNKSIVDSANINELDITIDRPLTRFINGVES